MITEARAAVWERVRSVVAVTQQAFVSRHTHTLSFRRSALSADDPLRPSDLWGEIGAVTNLPRRSFAVGGGAEGRSLASVANASKLAEDSPFNISQPPCLIFLLTLSSKLGESTL